MEEHGGRQPISAQSHFPRMIEMFSYEHLNRITSRTKLQQSCRDVVNIVDNMIYLETLFRKKQ